MFDPRRSNPFTYYFNKKLHVNVVINNFMDGVCWVRISSTIFIYSTFSALRPLYFDLSTSSALLRLVYFDLLSNMGFLLVEKHRSKYSFGQSKVWPKRSK